MSATETQSYSISDIQKVAERFAADLAMISQATGLRTAENAADVSADIKEMAKSGYLSRVNLLLLDSQGMQIRGRRYEVSTDASLWSSDRPGDNLWPRTVGGDLAIVVSYTATWHALSSAAQENFQASLRRPWGPTDQDTSHSGLSTSGSRRYASNSYGMERTDYQ